MSLLVVQAIDNTVTITLTHNIPERNCCMRRKVRMMPTMAWGKSGLEKEPTRKMTTNAATVSNTPRDCTTKQIML